MSHWTYSAGHPIDNNRARGCSLCTGERRCYKYHCTYWSTAGCVHCFLLLITCIHHKECLHCPFYQDEQVLRIMQAQDGHHHKELFPPSQFTHSVSGIFAHTPLKTIWIFLERFLTFECHLPHKCIGYKFNMCLHFFEIVLEMGLVVLHQLPG